MAYTNTAFSLSLVTQSKGVGQMTGSFSLSHLGAEALSSQLLPHPLGSECFNRSFMLARDDKCHFYWHSIGKDQSHRPT